ncbi:unnamed protein product [Lampetra fluviatilis]
MQQRLLLNSQQRAQARLAELERLLEEERSERRRAAELTAKLESGVRSNRLLLRALSPPPRPRDPGAKVKVKGSSGSKVKARKVKPAKILASGWTVAAEPWEALWETPPRTRGPEVQDRDNGESPCPADADLLLGSSLRTEGGP